MWWFSLARRMYFTNCIFRYIDSISIHTSFTECCDQISHCTSNLQAARRVDCNVQKPSYWTRLFANYNFYQDFAMRPQYVSPQAMFLTRGQNIPDVISNYEEQIYQLHKEHHNALQDLLSDRKKAQEIMDIQKEELDRLRSDFSLLQADRGVAQKIMDTQQAELERTRNEASLLHPIAHPISKQLVGWIVSTISCPMPSNPFAQNGSS